MFVNFKLPSLIRKLINKQYQSKYKFSNLSNKYYDIVISGAGPMGAAFASAVTSYNYFTQEDKKVLLIDQFEPPTLQKVISQSIPDHRVVSITKSTVKFLQSINAWQKFSHNRVGIIEKMQVWENQGTSFLRFNKAQSPDPISYVVENNHIIAAIFDNLNANKKVQYAFKNSIENFSRNEQGLIDVKLKSGETVQTKLIVGSDGRGSKVKEIAKMTTYGWSYNVMGIVCTIKTNQQTNTAWQRYLKSGPIAILPLWDDYSSIVWSVGLEEYEYLMKLNDLEFQNELNSSLSKPSEFNTPNFDIGRGENFEFVPLITQICNKRLAFPIMQLQAKRYIGDGIALIGDAAHSVHPQAGQGLNMGMNDAVCLANNVIRNLKSGNNIGTELSLKNYESDAKLWNYSNAASMETVGRVYSMRLGPLPFLRNLSVSLLNNLPEAKNIFMDIASHQPFAPRQYEWETE